MKLIIFTNAHSLATVKKDLVIEYNANEDEKSKDTDFGESLRNCNVLIRKNSCWQNVDLNESDGDIILINDTNYTNNADNNFVDNFNTWYNKIEKEDELTVFYHRRPEQVRFQLHTRNKDIWKKGDHEPNGKYYPEIADVLAAAENKSDKEIAQEIDSKLILNKGKIEKKKLEFLLSIYNGNKIDSEENKKYSSLLTEITNSTATSIDWLKNNKYCIEKDITDNETEGAEQRKHLSILRDALLN